MDDQACPEPFEGVQAFADVIGRYALMLTAGEVSDAKTEPAFFRRHARSARRCGL
jgi:hypothetical protein